MSAFMILSDQRCFGGRLLTIQHAAISTACTMRFTLFLPTQSGPRPALLYLAGLTCNEETFTTKAGACRVAAELGLILIAPDTSPRGEDVPDAEGWDIGKGAGFYLNATQAPWTQHYNMERYLTEELHALLLAAFPIDPARIGIFGHSMGGHGALTLYLRHPAQYRSVSAFAPICAPTQCPWGKKAFGLYLGPNRESWKAHDASALMRISQLKERPPILIDQGLADQFLAEQLHPEAFESACAEAGHPLELRRHEGYDHSYFFIQTFMEDHLHHHAASLG